MDTDTNAMSQEIKPAGISSAANLTIVPVEEDSAFASLHLAGQNPAAVIDLRHFILQQQAHPLGSRYNRMLKRATDITVSAFVITFLLSWITALIAILIKLDSRGPVFFLQKRNKRRGELFSCIKFRSMVCNADADILPAGKNDQRITRFGKFLRRYHLDELPQFFNVLLGDMSVIGPRPHMVSENIKFDGLIRNYAGRHRVKPGLTGLAQVMGFVGETDELHKMRSRVEMDLFYIRHWSLRLDLSILFRTICKSIRL